MNNADCIFCKIATKEFPSEVIYENEHVIAFLDIQPVHPGHTLVVPKAHARNILDISQDSWVHVAEAARVVAKKVKEGTSADGVNLIMNNEPAGHQVVFHPHVHIIPRFEGDGIKTWPHKELDPEEGKLLAEKIRAA